MAHTYDPSHSGGLGRRLSSRLAWASETLSQQINKKGWGCSSVKMPLGFIPGTRGKKD